MTEGDPPREPMWKEPRTVALVAGATVLVLGVPAVLLAARGRWDAVAVMVVLFAGMIAATATWLREAMEAGIDLTDDEDG